MKKKFISYLLVGLLGTGVGVGGTISYNNLSANIQKENTAVHDVTTGILLATFWQQNSGEVKALRYEAYNSGMKYIDKLITEETTKPYAVTLDIDETVLDNSPYRGYVVKNNEVYSSETFKEWTKMSKAKAIEGAKEFTDYAKDKRIEVFYVSNRGVDELETTIKNMKDLGFVNADKEHILLKEDTNSKTTRWNRIRENYNLAIYCGDNLGDFPNEYDKKSNKERSSIVSEDSSEFGDKYIILPNPTYGDFEGAAYNYNYKKSADEKLKDLLDSISSFK